MKQNNFKNLEGESKTDSPSVNTNNSNLNRQNPETGNSYKNKTNPASNNDVKDNNLNNLFSNKSCNS